MACDVSDSNSEIHVTLSTHSFTLLSIFTYRVHATEIYAPTERHLQGREPKTLLQAEGDSCFFLTFISQHKSVNGAAILKQDFFRNIFSNSSVNDPLSEIFLQAEQCSYTQFRERNAKRTYSQDSEPKCMCIWIILRGVDGWLRYTHGINIHTRHKHTHKHTRSLYVGMREGS